MQLILPYKISVLKQLTFQMRRVFFSIFFCIIWQDYTQNSAWQFISTVVAYHWMSIFVWGVNCSRTLFKPYSYSYVDKIGIKGLNEHKLQKCSDLKGLENVAVHRLSKNDKTKNIITFLTTHMEHGTSWTDSLITNFSDILPLWLQYALVLGLQHLIWKRIHNNSQFQDLATIEI